MKEILLILISCVLSHAAYAERLKASFGLLPKSVDTVNVNSAHEFRFLVEITARLVSSNGTEVSGDLARKWNISDDRRVYLFTIETNRKFSDGSIITTDDVVASLERTIRGGFSIHADVSNISSVQKIDGNAVRITLKNPDPFFIQDISYPEFSILSKADQTAPIGSQTFKVTSGPYFVNSWSEDKIILQKNTNYPAGISRNFEEIEFTEIRSADKEKTVQSIIDFKYDYFWAPNINRAQHQKLLDAGYKEFPTRNSYTFWITFNPKSKIFSKIHNRRAVQKIFFDNPIDVADRYPRIQNTYQIYHPQGPGRLSVDEAKHIYSSIKSTVISPYQTIRLVTFDGASYNQKICNTLKKYSLRCDLILISDFDEYKKILAKPDSYDAIIMNNDFSFDFLRKSLQIALYNERPLILVDEADAKLREAFERSKISTDSIEIIKLQRYIGERLLEKAYAMPLFFDTRVIYIRNKLDHSAWSETEWDYSLWKIQQ